MTRFALVGVILQTLVLSSAVAEAQSTPADGSARARQLFEQGVALSDAQRWGEAAEHFRQSAALVERPNTFFSLGVALMHTSQPVDARAAFTRFLALANEPRFAAQRREAERMIAESEQSQAVLALRVNPPSASVEIDGIAVAPDARGAIALNPGAHVALIHAEGYEPFHTRFTLATGDRVVRDAQLQAAPSTVPSARETAAASADNQDERLIDQGEQSRSVFAKPVFWIVAGLVVAAAVTTTLLITQSGTAAPDTGNTGWVGMALTP